LVFWKFFKCRKQLHINMYNSKLFYSYRAEDKVIFKVTLKEFIFIIVSFNYNLTIMKNYLLELLDYKIKETPKIILE